MSKRELTEKEIHDIIEYYKSHSTNATANYFHITYEIIYDILQQNNIELHPKYYYFNKDNLPINEIIEYYKDDHSLMVTAKNFKIGLNTLKKILIQNNIKLHTKEEENKFRTQHSIQSKIDKYGSMENCQKQAAEKSKQTNLEKYGTTSYSKTEMFRNNFKNIVEDRINTQLANLNIQDILNFYEYNSTSYTLSTFNISDKLLNKILEDNNLQLHTVEENVKFGQEKSKKTCNLKYNVEYTFQVGEFREKSNQTKFEKHSDPNYNNREKAEETCNERYGVSSASKCPEVKEKGRQTRLEKYGDPNYNNREQADQTKLEKYGDPNYNNRESARQTMLNKYGVEYCIQSFEIASKMKNKFSYNSILFDSSWELALWIYAKDHDEEIERCPCYFEYFIDDKKHKYFPDFKYKGKLIEIKGDQFFNDDGSFVGGKEKYACMIDNNITIWKWDDIKFAINYIKATYGKNYLKQFKNK